MEYLQIAYVMQNTGVDIHQSVGAPILVRNTLSGLTKSGHDVDLLSLQGRSVLLIEDINQIELQREISFGVTGSRIFKLIESGIRRIQGLLNLAYYAIFDSFRFCEILIKLLPKYIICHEYQGLFSVGASLACSRSNTPHILTADADLILERDISGNPLRGLHRWIALKEAKFVFNRVQRIICVSEPAKHHLIDVWGIKPEKISVLPNGVDVDMFGKKFDTKQVRSEYHLSNFQIVGFVGGFQPWHGLENLIESFYQVIHEVPKVKLILIGDGPVRDQINHKIRDLGLESSVMITGYIPQNQVPQLLSVVDIAVLPYPELPKELWFSPLKLYEYMAAGKAIVASDSGQIGEVLSDGITGKLVKPGDISGMSEAIIELLKNKKERELLGSNAQQQALEQHSWDHYIHQLEEIYLEVLEKHTNN